MSKDMSHKVVKMSKVCPANFSIKVCVCRQVLTKLEAFFINMSVHRAIQEMAKLSLILRRNVRTNTRFQKTSKVGRE